MQNTMHSSRRGRPTNKVRRRRKLQKQARGRGQAAERARITLWRRHRLYVLTAEERLEATERYLRLGPQNGYPCYSERFKAGLNGRRR